MVFVPMGLQADNVATGRGCECGKENPMAQVQFETYISTYADAFRSIRRAKNVFWLLVVLGILAQLASFVLIEFVGMLHKLPEADPTAKVWEEVFHWSLQATLFISLMVATLLVLTILFAVKLSLIGRLGSVAAFLSAFFWSLLLWVTLVPWQLALSGRFASGALFSLTELQNQMARMARDPSMLDRILFYARFIAYPAISLLLALIVMVKTARGVRETTAVPSASAPPVSPAEPPRAPEA